jgi:hypothetical protein
MTSSGQRGEADADIPTEGHTPADAGSSAAAEAGAQPSSGGTPVGKRVHRLLVPGLLVLATALGIGATFAIWVNRQALNTSNWSSTSGKILQDKKVQTALSAYLVHELFANVDVSTELQTVCPSSCSRCPVRLRGGLQQLAGQLAPRLLASPPTATRQGNRRRGAGLTGTRGSVLLSALSVTAGPTRPMLVPFEAEPVSPPTGRSDSPYRAQGTNRAPDRARIILTRERVFVDGSLLRLVVRQPRALAGMNLTRTG